MFKIHCFANVDNHKVQMLNQQVKHDRLVQQMKEDMMKAMADRNNSDLIEINPINSVLVT